MSILQNYNVYLQSKSIKCFFVVHFVPKYSLFTILFNLNQRCVEMDTKRGVIDIRNPKAQQNEVPKQFSFDAIYDWKYSLSVQHHSSFHFKLKLCWPISSTCSLACLLSDNKNAALNRRTCTKRRSESWSRASSTATTERSSHTDRPAAEKLSLYNYY